MPGSGAPRPLGLAWVSVGLVGAAAWTGSGSRATGGCWGTSLETGLASWVEEACVRRVWPH